MSAAVAEPLQGGPQDGKALLARIRPTKRRERIQMCLRPDLVQLRLDLDEELEAGIARVSSERLSSGTKVAKGNKELALRIQKVDEEIEAACVWFTVEQLNKDRWQVHLDSNPPREDNVLDMYVGYNRDAVLDAAIREGLVDPNFEDCTDATCKHDDCGTFDQFAKLTPGQEWTELRNIANIANSGVVDPPKSDLALEILGPRGRGSAQPKSGE